MGLEMLALHNRIFEKLHTSSVEVREKNMRLLIAFLALFGYMLVGALVFCHIEAPLEKIEHETYAEFRQIWTKKLTAKGITEDEIDRLFANIRDAALNGVWMEKNVSSDLYWSVGRAFFFTGTLLTTVGFGQQSPRTRQGKLFTIIFCIVGIPFCLALLSAVAVRLRWPSAWLRARINMRFGGALHGRHLQLLHLALVSCFVLVIAFILPSWIFMAIEKDWSFIDSFYYCFVSLTTIGLGDYMPGDQPDQPARNLYKFFVTIYLLFGLGCMMLFLATLYDVPQFNLVRHFVTMEEEGEEGECKPATHMHNGAQKYTRYDRDSPGNTSIPEFVGGNGHFYQ
ncbi:Two pore potassium channel protein sup-9 [Aphelenchoides fujianensis]|nr:Two pore potassium channel protein sup-9 [Aphelenchoides fujianensis]